MKKFVIVVILLFMLPLSNGFKESVKSSPLFWKWGERDVIIEYKDIVRNNDSIVANVTAYITIPPNLPNQEIKSIEFSPKPDEILKDKWGQSVAHYSFSLLPNETRVLSWRVEAKIYNIRYILLPFLVRNEIPSDILEKYTADDEMYKIHDPFIQQIVEEVAGDEENLLIKAVKLHDYVIARLSYAIDERWDDAPTVLKRGNGSCSEYCFAYIALCRAAGIPAQYKGGTYFPPKAELPHEDDIFHRMVLIYLPNYGWIPVDMTFDEWIFHHYAFGAHTNRFFALMKGGGSSEYLNWTYNSVYHSNANLEVNSSATWLQWNSDSYNVIMDRLDDLLLL